MGSTGFLGSSGSEVPDGLWSVNFIAFVQPQKIPILVVIGGFMDFVVQGVSQHWTPDNLAKSQSLYKIPVESGGHLFCTFYSGLSTVGQMKFCGRLVLVLVL